MYCETRLPSVMECIVDVHSYLRTRHSMLTVYHSICFYISNNPNTIFCGGGAMQFAQNLSPPLACACKKGVEKETGV